MAERSINAAIKSKLLTNEPFQYAHLVKFERPFDPVDGVFRTNANRYAYYTDAAHDITFSGNIYRANRITSIGQYSETTTAKATSMNLTLAAEDLGAKVIVNGAISLGDGDNDLDTIGTFTPSSTVIDGETLNFVEKGFKEGDKLLFTLTQTAGDFIIGSQATIVSAGNTSFTAIGAPNNTVGTTFTVTGAGSGTGTATIKANYIINSFTTNNTAITFKRTGIDSDDPSMLAVSSTSFTVTLESDELTAVLQDRGITIDSTAAASPNFINRIVEVHKVFIEPDTGLLIGTSILAFKGIIASVSIQESPNKAQVTWTLTSHWGDFEAVQGRLTTDEVHRALNSDGSPNIKQAIRPEYAGDLGFLHAETSLSAIANYKSYETKFRQRSKRRGLGFRKKYWLEEYQEEVEREVDLNIHLAGKELPVVYGVQRIEGIPVFADTLDGDSKTVYVVHALCEGEIHGLYNMYIDDVPIICTDDNDYGVRNIDAEGSSESQLQCYGNMSKGQTLNAAIAELNQIREYVATQLQAINTQLNYGANNNVAIERAMNQAAAMGQYKSMNNVTIAQLTAGAASGMQHEESFNINHPYTMEWYFHTGRANQTADNALVTIAENTTAGTNFKRQEDYYTGDLPYWAENHRLLDTAYVVTKFTIKDDATELPDVEYIAKGKVLECYNYDDSYIPDVVLGAADNAANFTEGDLVTVEYSADGSSWTTDASGTFKILDKYTFTTSRGAQYTRFRLDKTPSLNIVNGTPTQMYVRLKSGSNYWHMITWNQGLVTTETSFPNNLWSAVDRGSSPWAKNNDNELTAAVSDSVYTALGTDDMFFQFRKGTWDSSVSGLQYGVLRGVWSGDAGSRLLTFPNTDYTGLTDELNTSNDIAKIAKATVLPFNISPVNSVSNVAAVEGSILKNTTTGEEREITDFNTSTNKITIETPFFTPSTEAHKFTITGRGRDLRSSSNPAIQTLDYIRSKRFGKSLTHDDLDLDSFINSARLCDTRSDITIPVEDADGVALNDIFTLTHDGESDGNHVASGKVIAFEDSNDSNVPNYITLTQVINKFAKQWSTHTEVLTGDIIYTEDSKFYRSTGGSSPTEPTHDTVDETVNNLTYIGKHSDAAEANPVKIYKTAGTGTASSLNYTKKGIPVEYSLYDADWIKYWRYYGWEQHHQRWVTRHQTNFILDTGKSVFANMNALLDHFNGILSYENGKYVLDVETQETAPAISLNATQENINPFYIESSDIIGSISLKDNAQRTAKNTIKASIADPQNNYGSRSVTFFNSDFLEADRNVIKTGQFPFTGITNYYNGRIGAEKELFQSRFSKEISFTVGPRGILLRAGEVIALTYEPFGWASKLFRIENLSFKADCNVSIKAREYDDSIYEITKQQVARIVKEASPQYALKAPLAPGIAGRVTSFSDNTVDLASGSLANGTYTAVAHSATSGDGEGMTVTMTVASNATTAVTIVNPGTGYAVNDTVTFTNQNSQTNSLVLTISKIDQLTATTTTPGSVVLTWGNATNYNESSDDTEIWSSPINDRTNATLLTTVDNAEEYTHTHTLGGTDYYWVRHRRISQLTQSNATHVVHSPYHPTSSTGGVTGTSADIGAGLVGPGTNFIFKRADTNPNPSSGPTADGLNVPSGWDDLPNETSNSNGEGFLWASKGTVAAGGTAYVWSRSYHVDGTGISEQKIYSDVVANNGAAPGIPSANTSTFDFTDYSLTINDSNWNANPPSVSNDGDTVYSVAAIVNGSHTHTSRGITWSTPASIFARKTDGSDGSDAKTVRLTVDDYSISYDADGANPSPSGNMTLTGTSKNFTNGYFKFTGDGITDEGSYTDGSGANADTFTFAIPTSYFSAPKSLKVSVQEGSSGGEVAFDTISITAIKPGAAGEDGDDGAGIEYIFAVTADSGTVPSTPQNSWGFDQPSGGWSDAAPALTTSNKVLWRAQRAIVGNPSAGDTVSANWSSYSVVGRYADDGTHGMSFVVTNSSHTFPATVAGAVSSYDHSGTIIEVYEGATQLAYDGTGTSASTWKTTEAATNITVGTKTDSGAYLTVGNHSGVADGTDLSKIIYTISGERADETAFSTTVQQSFSKSKIGATGGIGATGSAGRTVGLTAGTQAFTYTAAGATPAPSNTTLTATATNTTGTVYYDFLKNDSSVQNGTGTTYTYTPQAAHSNMPDKMEVRIREGANDSTILARDQLDMIGVKPGTDGDPAHTGFLTNAAHVVSADNDGTGYSLSGAGGTFKMYDGATDVTGGNTTYYAQTSGTSLTETKNGLTMTITQSSGAYALSGGSWTSDSEEFTLRGTHGGVTSTLVYSISKSKKGAGAISAILSNDNHTLPASNAGVVSSYTGSGTTIKVYEGETALTFQTGTVLAGQFAVAIGNTANITEGTASGDESTTCTIGPHSAAADGTDSFVITYTISGKFADGTSFTTLTKDQTLTKQKTGAAGAAGANSATVTLYRKSSDGSSAPAAFSGTFTYTFATGAVTGGTLNSWTTALPSITNGEYIWQRQATASSTSSTDTVPTSEFSAAVVHSGVGANGSSITGAAGNSNALVALYRVSTSNSSAPAAFSGTFTYTFATGAVTGGTLNSWTATAPNVPDGSYLWVRQATASAAATTDTIATSEFSAAVVIGGVGEDGDPGPTGSGLKIAYKNATFANKPATPTANGLNAPSGWSFSDSTPGSGEISWISIGTVGVDGTAYTWGIVHMNVLEKGDLLDLGLDVGDFSSASSYLNANVTVGTLGAVATSALEWGAVCVTSGALVTSWRTDDGSAYLPSSTTQDLNLSIAHPTIGVKTVTARWTRSGGSLSAFGFTAGDSTGDDNWTWGTGTGGTGEGSPQDATDFIYVKHVSSGSIIGLQANIIDLSGLGGCLLPNSQIKTPTGTKAIKNIEVGQTVLTYNTDQKLESEAKVTDKASHRVKSYYKLNDLELTAGHPVWVNNHWACISPEDYYRECELFNHTLDLEPNKIELGDKLHTDELISKIEKVNKEVEVWNIVVEPSHTYIANNILVHNGGGGGGKCLTPAMLPEGLQIGDEIDSPEGKTKVVDIIHKQREGYYILEDELEITNDHPILINGEWILAEEYAGKKEYIDEKTEVIYVETENELLTVKGWTVGGKY